MYFESEKPSGASRAFCFFYSQSARESFPVGEKPLPSLMGKERFFLKIREGAHFSSLFAYALRRLLDVSFSLSLSVSLSVCVQSAR